MKHAEKCLKRTMVAKNGRNQTPDLLAIESPPPQKEAIPKVVSFFRESKNVHSTSHFPGDRSDDRQASWPEDLSLKLRRALALRLEASRNWAPEVLRSAADARPVGDVRHLRANLSILCRRRKNTHTHTQMGVGQKRGPKMEPWQMETKTKRKQGILLSRQRQTRRLCGSTMRQRQKALFRQEKHK